MDNYEKLSSYGPPHHGSLSSDLTAFWHVRAPLVASAISPPGSHRDIFEKSPLEGLLNLMKKRSWKKSKYY